jgi:hypothetical protein
MAYSDITITTTAEAGVVYSMISSAGTQALRADTARSLSEPRLLEISHQAGSATKPDRHMVRATQTEQSSTDDAVFETGSCHIVFTCPRSVVSVAMVKELFLKLSTYLTASSGAAIDALLKGGLG